MTPFINWAGSRVKDLRVIHPLIPKDIETFIDPFVGDGACFLEVEAKNYVLADKNQDLMDCWRTVQTSGPRFRALLAELGHVWQRCDAAFELIRDGLIEIKNSVDSGLFSDYPAKVNAVIRVVDKIGYDDVFGMSFSEPMEFQIELRHQMVCALERMDPFTDKDLAESAFYTAFKAAVFKYLVEVYNKPESKNALRSAFLIFLMEYAWNGRFVAEGNEFRPEYGGKHVNNRTINLRENKAICEELVAKLEKTRFFCQDIFRSLGFPFAKDSGSFLFLDIPSKSLKDLSQTGRKRLASFLRSGTKARWMAICDPNDIIVDNLLFEEPKMISHAIPLGKEIIIMNY